MAIFSWMWSLVTKAFGLVLSIFPSPSSVGKLKPAIPAAIFVGVLILLTLLNYALDLDRVILAPWAFLRRLWLPILFVLVWVLCWLGWWLWRLLNLDEDVALYPDIDAAWNEALALLKDAGIGVADAPLYILLGRNAQDDALLFNSTPEPLLVNQPQHSPLAPVRVFAHRGGIYLSCPGASLSSRQAELLMGSAGAGNAMSAPLSGDALAGGKAYATVPADVAMALGVAGKTTPAVSVDSGGTPAVTVPAKEAGDASNLEEKNADISAPKRRLPRSRTHLLRQQEEVDLLTARLQYVCRLIGRARAPYCPLNGILMMVPMAATGNDDDAQQMGAVCRRDLATIREVLQIRCPFLTVLGGLEKLDGFREFKQRIPRELASQRLGQDFPLMPDLDPDAIRKMIESGVLWVCRGMVPRAVFRLLKTESGGGTASEAAAVNARFFRFIQEISERGKRFAQIAVRAGMAEGPALLAGCYLAGTGADPNSEQAFMTGCFRLMAENQNYVSWTAQALNEEAEYYRLTRVGYAVTWGLIAAMVVLGYFVWPRSY